MRASSGECGIRASSGECGFECLRRFLPVSGVKLLQVARDALLDLRHTPLHLGACEVPVTVVYRLELAAVDRHAGLREKAHRAAKRNKLGADLADGAAVVLCLLYTSDAADEEDSVAL